MRATLNGTRGSVGRAGPTTVRYGGDTSSVEVTNEGGSTLILDAGSGIVHSGSTPESSGRIDILLTHLHMDHIQGLGFFAPLFEPDVHVHIWGPISTTTPLIGRLGRYLSPPLFPVHLRDLPSVSIHDLAPGTVDIGPFTVKAEPVIHPGQTYGYRVEAEGRSIAYLPDHEPALGSGVIAGHPAWTSGYDLAEGVDVLIHDTQYTPSEYASRIGWGHSTLRHAVDFADLAGVGRLITFHHDPNHSDEEIDAHHREVRMESASGAQFEAGVAGLDVLV